MAPTTTRQNLVAELNSLKEKPSKSKGSTRKSHASGNAANKENTGPTATAQEDNDGGIHWSHTDLHHLTDRLLTIIEESPRFRQIFGFKVDDEYVNSGGLGILPTCRLIAPMLFPNKTIAGDKIPLSIKNRVGTIKSSYSEHRTKLGETGHGLVADGREDEMVDGTPMANIWQSIKKKFPWYKRLNDLLFVSPVHDRSALANSTTRVDTSVLLPPSAEEITPDADAELGLNDAGSQDSSFHSGIGFDDDILGNPPSSPIPDTISLTEVTAASAPTPAAAPTPPPPSSTATPAKVVPQKRKQIAETLREVNESAQATRIRLAEIQIEGKRQRSEDREKRRLERQQMKLQAQFDLQRQAQEHERAMLQLQIQLTLTKQGQGPAGPAFTFDAPALDI